MYRFCGVDTIRDDVRLFPMAATRFTRHARNRMRLWGLRSAEVLDAMARPDRVTAEPGARANAWRYSAGRWLRVTYTDDQRGRVAITVTVRRRGPGEEG